jgi:hypothetical protein
MDYTPFATQIASETKPLTGKAAKIYKAVSTVVQKAGVTGYPAERMLGRFRSTSSDLFMASVENESAPSTKVEKAAK